VPPDELAATRLTFRAAAQKLLAEAGEPLHPRVLAERALAGGLVKTTGKTPEATMAAQLYTDIQAHGEQSTFVRVGRGLFGLRAWGIAGPPPKKPRAASKMASLPKVIPLAQDGAERLAAEVLTAQYDSFNSVHFERVLTEAFAFLGFRATHVGGPGQTDIVLDAPVSAGPYRVVVDAKSNKGGRIADASIDWNSLADHRKAADADHALVVAPDFGGGNLLKRADDYGVALMPAGAVPELIRLHRSAPFSLVELRVLFEAPGRVTKGMEQLRQLAQATLARWRLLGELVTLLEQLPAGEYADAQKLWLLLFFQHKENAPLREAVEDAVNILSSRAVGVLRPINGSDGYQVTMQADTAIRRLHAMVQALEREASPANQAVPLETEAVQDVPARHPNPKYERAAVVQPPSTAADFDSARSQLLERLRSLGFGAPEPISKRHVRLERAVKYLGLAFRNSKLYPNGKWWWSFTDAADRAPLSGCDAVVLVGLMQDPADPTRARPEVVFVRWQEAVATTAGSKAWQQDGRMHVYVQPNSQRWGKRVIHPTAIDETLIRSLLQGKG